MIYLDYVPKTEYKIYQDRDKFSFGSDAIILSSFAKMKKASRLLDIGAGNGILSLRTNYLYDLGEVVSVEIQRQACELFEESIRYNNIGNIRLIKGDIKDRYRDLDEDSFDYIITNPPYMKKGEGLVNLNENQAISRMEKYLNLEDIFKISKSLLKNRGKLFMVNRPRNIEDIFLLSNKYRLRAKRARLVQGDFNKRPKLILFEFVKNGGSNFVFENTLLLRNGSEETREIKDIYGKI